MLDEGLEDVRSGHAPDGGKYTPILRDELPSAHEVSEEWVRYEDRLADAIISEEAHILREALQKERDAEQHTRTLSVRAKKGAGKGKDGLRDRDAEKARRVS